MSKINHAKRNALSRASKVGRDQKSKSISKRRVKISKDLATDAQKKYMKVLGIDFTSETTLRQAIELIRAKKLEIERSRKQDAAIPTLD